jgi:hypothetical protein
MLDANEASTLQSERVPDLGQKRKAATRANLPSKRSPERQHRTKPATATTTTTTTIAQPVRISRSKPHVLRRSWCGAALLWSLDVLYILLWLGMLVYVALLWRYDGTPTNEIPFDTKAMVEAAAPVSIAVLNVL